MSAAGGGAGGGAKKRPRSSDDAGAAASKLLALLENGKKLMKQSEIERVFSGNLSVEEIVGGLNSLAQAGRVEFHDVGGEMAYKLVSQEAAAQRSDLAVEEQMVLQEVERAGNMGVWVRNIKLRTKLQQTQLNKVLKRLESRKLIKPVRSVAFKNRRMYMSYALQPAKELTGGAWYTNEVLDVAYVNGMRDASVKLLRELRRPASAREISNIIAERRISNAKIGVGDIRQLLDTLVYDGVLDYADAGEVRLRSYPRAARHMFPGVVALRYEAGSSSGDWDDGGGAGGEAEEAEAPGTGQGDAVSGFNIEMAGTQAKFIVCAGGGSGARVGPGPGSAFRLADAAARSYARDPPGHDDEDGGPDEEEEDKDYEEGDSEDDEDEDEDDEDDDESSSGAGAGAAGGRKGGRAGGGRLYTYVKPANADGSLFEGLSGAPCGTCPVFRQCVPGGVISPETCTYYTTWLQAL